jgi:hypothetical protein
MANPVKFLFGTEEQILALEPTDENWVELAFYYPSDQTYFYQAIEGVMQKKGYCTPSIQGIGITLNSLIIGGVKSVIEETDILTIPENYEYNVVNLQVQGVINNAGQINIIN